MGQTLFLREIVDDIREHGISHVTRLTIMAFFLVINANGEKGPKHFSQVFDTQTSKESKIRKCKNNETYVSPQGLRCDAYAGLSCSKFADIGFTEDDVLELEINCPRSCDSECLLRQMSSENMSNAIRSRPEIRSLQRDICVDGEDIESYVSPQGAKCSAYQGWDCTLFSIVGFSEFQLFQLINSCPATCQIPCGTFTISPSGAPSVSPSLSLKPSISPSHFPTVVATEVPTVQPSTKPSTSPSAEPTAHPTEIPSTAPTASPTFVPSRKPSEAPTSFKKSRLFGCEGEDCLVEKLQRGKLHVDLLTKDVEQLESTNEKLSEDIEKLEEQNAALLSYINKMEESNRVNQFLQGVLVSSLETCTNNLDNAHKECENKIAKTEGQFKKMKREYYALLDLGGPP